MTKGIIIAFALSLFLFTGCSKDSVDSTLDGDGDAYISLALINEATTVTRANSINNGTKDESMVSSVTVVCYDEFNVRLAVVDFGPMVIGGSDGAGKPDAEPSDAKRVDFRTKKIVVILNHKSNLENTLQTATWDLNSASNDTWDKLIKQNPIVTVKDIATAGQFVMVNAGVEGSNGLCDVTLSKTPDDAVTNPVVIAVERLAVKVLVTQNDQFNSKPTGSQFNFLGWEFNTVARNTQLYTEAISYPEMSSSAQKVYYRIDGTYYASQTIDKEWTLAQKDYSWLTNSIDLGESKFSVSPVTRPLKEAGYCTENTMDALCQTWGFTTKVVVRANYTPAGLSTADWNTTKPSFFSWGENYYTLEQLKTEYKSNSGLRIDLVNFLRAALLLPASPITDPTDSDIDKVLLSGNFNAYTGIRARNLALRYYHESVSYYDVLIRHDDNVKTIMGLGRYGVVRNNFYTLDLTSVLGPGTPWIPDPTDPTGPINPTDPDDKEVSLSVSITVDPWIINARLVDLN